MFNWSRSRETAAPSGLTPGKAQPPPGPAAPSAFDLSGGADYARLQQLAAAMAPHSQSVRRLSEQVGRVVVGQQALIRQMIIGLLTGGHLLIEGVPGLAKTTAVATLARTVQMTFQRVQFTPDLLPADLIGTQIYRPQDHRFEVKKGPLFANLVLADEINRAPAKVQSALLEAMQEHQVTIGTETFPLPQPFLVMATQNPIEQEGTYPLPEAQLDRFMLKALVRYPRREEEGEILDRMASTRPGVDVEPVLTPAEILAARDWIDQVYLDRRVRDYIIDLVIATREPCEYGNDLAGLIQFGASPRATISLTLAAKAGAFLEGRAYVTPHDVKLAAPSVLRHRIILTYEAEAEEQSADDIIRVLLDAVPMP